MKKIITYFTVAVFSLALYSCGATNVKSTKDGLSYKNAIKVNSVQEEYKFVKQNCPDCKFKSQALIQNNGKTLDVLTFEKPDGTMVKYYFNIKSFYGKFY